MEDTEAVLHEMIQLLEQDEDEKTVSFILKTYSEIETLYEKKLHKLQELIEEQTLKTNKSKSESLRKLPKEEIDKEKGTLENEIKQITADIQKLEATLEELRTQKEKVQGSNLELISQMAELDSEKVKKSPVIHYALCLYHDISKINWNYETENRIAGWIKKSGSVTPFSLEIDKPSTYIADCLWDLIDF